MKVKILRKTDGMEVVLFEQIVVEGDQVDLSRFYRVENSLHAHIGNHTMIVGPGQKVIIEHDGPAGQKLIEEKPIEDDEMML